MIKNSGINIAIDGYSSTGKSTLAKSLAAKLGYRHIDTGAMYRAVTLFGLRKGLIDSNRSISRTLVFRAEAEAKLEFRFNPEKNCSEIFMNNENVEEEIREMKVAHNVSEVAAISEIRSSLVNQQREMAKNKKIVMNGRDIGTVVLPDAELKIFMTANEEVRIERRFRDLQAKWEEARKEEIAKNINERDHKDSNRADSPLKQAVDAVLLDNSDLTPEEQMEMALDWVKEKL